MQNRGIAKASPITRSSDHGEERTDPKEVGIEAPVEIVSLDPSESSVQQQGAAWNEKKVRKL